MIQFKKLEKNVEEIKKVFGKEQGYFCDFTIGTRYIWGDAFSIEYAYVNDTLILKEFEESYGEAFYFPIGNNVEDALKEIENYAQKTFKPLCFCCLTESQAEFLKNRYYLAENYFEREWSDYVYLVETFKEYSGKKLASKRNHVNKFTKLYPNYTVEKVNNDNKQQVFEFFNQYKNSGKELSNYEISEIENLSDYVNNLQELNQFGIMLKVDSIVVGVSFGEITGDMLTVHVEKANVNYDGVYPTLAKEFAKTFAKENVKYINREEDCGDQGLRTSKMRYCPVEIRHKYVVKAKTLFDKIVPPIEIDAGELKIVDINNSQKQEFFLLSTDQELNKWWGYDYREDLDEPLSPDYFLKFVRKMKETKEEYSFAVTLNNHLIGELVLHNFDYFGGVEMGFRFLKLEQKKGYATISATALKNYAICVLGAKKIKSRCFKENIPSFRLIERLELKKVSEDSTHFYFEQNIN